jgi:hypothetical protein
MKFEYYRIRGAPLKLAASYFSNRYQYVDFMGEISMKILIKMGIAQGSLWGPFVFITYINDLPVNINGFTSMFADDTTVAVKSKSIKVLAEKGENAVKDAEVWFSANRLILNHDKTVNMNFTASRREKSLHGGSTKFLGIYIDTLLTFKLHVEYLNQNLASAVYAIRRIRDIIGKEAAVTCYHTLFHSKMTYGIKAWGNSAHAKKVFLMQKKAVRAIENLKPDVSCNQYFKKYKILTLFAVFLLEIVLEVKKKISDHRKREEIHNYGTRNCHNLDIPNARLRVSDMWSIGMRVYNILPEEWKTSVKTLKRKLKDKLILDCPYSVEYFFCKN